MGRGVQVFMNGWKKAFSAVCLLIAAVFVGANLLLHALTASSDSGRPYRVEAGRIALEIEEKSARSCTGWITGRIRTAEAVQG